jgi:hypothetical protein
MNERIVRSPHLIILNNEPRMMREMLQRALDQTPGVIVVDQGADLTRLSDLLQQVQLDWLVVTLGPDGAIGREALICMKRTPSLSLLALSPDGVSAEVLLKRAGSQEVIAFHLIEIRLTALVSILRYKWDDATLPAVLCAMRAFHIGEERAGLQSARRSSVLCMDKPG